MTFLRVGEVDRRDLVLAWQNMGVAGSAGPSDPIEAEGLAREARLGFLELAGQVAARPSPASDGVRLPQEANRSLRRPGPNALVGVPFSDTWEFAEGPAGPRSPPRGRPLEGYLHGLPSPPQTMRSLGQLVRSDRGGRDEIVPPECWPLDGIEDGHGPLQSDSARDDLDARRRRLILQHTALEVTGCLGFDSVTPGLERWELAPKHAEIAIQPEAS